MNIYVSNLSFSTSESDLSEVFAKYGEIASVKLILDRDTGRSRGFAFVEMPNADEAQSAIDGLNEKEVNGRAMSVSVAREKSDRGDRGGGGGNRSTFNRGGGGGGNRRW